MNTAQMEAVQRQVDEVNALQRQRDARIERQLALAGIDVVELVEYLAPLIKAENE